MASNLSVASNSLLLIWVEPAEVAGSFRLRFSQWRAGAWAAATTIAEHPSIVANWADTPSVREAVDGTLVAQWSERLDDSSHATNVLVARSTDSGKTWVGLGPAHDDDTQTEHGFVSLLADDPSVRAFWLDGRETGGGMRNRGAMTLRTAKISERVIESEVLDDSVCDCCGTSAAMTSQGPIVVFRDRLPGEIRDISIIRRVGGAWTAPRPVHADGWKIPGCPVNGPAVAAEKSRVAVAWFTDAAGRAVVKVAFSIDAGATFAEPVEVDAPRGRVTPMGRVGVVLDDHDGAFVSWMASNREQAQVLVRRVIPAGRRSSPVVLAQSQSNRDSGFPRLARSTRELFVVWTEASTPSHLRFQAVPLSALPAATQSATLPSVQEVAVLTVDSLMPDYSAQTLEGKDVSVSLLRGQVVLLNFWATWCEPCRAELPTLAMIYQRYASRGLQVLGVSLDAQQTPAQVKSFADRRKVPYLLWLDSQDLASRKLGIATLPVTVLIRRDGTVAWSQVGAIGEDDQSLSLALESALR